MWDESEWLMDVVVNVSYWLPMRSICESFHKCGTAVFILSFPIAMFPLAYLTQTQSLRKWLLTGFLYINVLKECQAKLMTRCQIYIVTGTLSSHLTGTTVGELDIVAFRWSRMQKNQKHTNPDPAERKNQTDAESNIWNNNECSPPYLVRVQWRGRATN